MRISNIMTVVAGRHGNVFDVLQRRFNSPSEGFDIGNVLTGSLQANDAGEDRIIKESKIALRGRYFISLLRIFCAAV